MASPEKLGSQAHLEEKVFVGQREPQERKENQDHRGRKDLLDIPAVMGNEEAMVIRKRLEFDSRTNPHFLLYR